MIGTAAPRGGQLWFTREERRVAARLRTRDPADVRALVVIDRSRRMPFEMAFPPPDVAPEFVHAVEARRRARNDEVAAVAAARGQQARAAVEPVMTGSLTAALARALGLLVDDHAQ